MILAFTMLNARYLLLLVCLVGGSRLTRSEVEARGDGARLADGVALEMYEADVDGDVISIFEMVRHDGEEDLEDGGKGEEINVSSATSLPSFLRSLMAKTKVDCRKPKNKKKKACRKPTKPSKKKPPPPPPKRSPPPPPRSPPPPPPFQDEYVYEAPELPPAPVVQPSPPPPVVVYNQVRCDFTPRRKILSGPRMVPNGGIRPCTGLHVADAGSCCETCRNTYGCNGWMYTKPIDCRAMGNPVPENTCYMLSDVTGSYDPSIPELEYQSGTADY